ncbi:hypothetical protein ASE41_34975 [Streptomyces sp. Root264]|nr:hypothetical protein ASE41_34975 [Streptomyces sp. Root264]
MRNTPETGCPASPRTIGSYTRAAPSTTSSGVRNPAPAIRAFFGAGFSSVTQPVSTAHMCTPCSASAAALVRVSMFRAALAMLVCGCPGILLRTANRPSTAVTLITYRRGRGDASSNGSSRSHSSAGASALTSWVSRTSAGSSAPSRTDQEFSGEGSGSSPASSASRSAAGSADTVPPSPSSILIGVKPGARRAPSGRTSRSPAASSAYDSGGRRTVCAALLTRMSNGSPSWRSSSHSPSTCRGSRRSTARTVSRCSHRSLPGSARKRRTASCGNREVTTISAPSRSIISASWKPILTLPPVSSTRRPLRSVLSARRAALSAAQPGQSRW